MKPSAEDDRRSGGPGAIPGGGINQKLKGDQKMEYKEYLNMINEANSRQELEAILKMIEDNEKLSARKYCTLRYYIIVKIYK